MAGIRHNNKQGGKKRKGHRRRACGAPGDAAGMPPCGPTSASQGRSSNEGVAPTAHYGQQTAAAAPKEASVVAGAGDGMVVNNAMPARPAAHSLAAGLPDSLFSDDEGECCEAWCGLDFAGEGAALMPAASVGASAGASPGKGPRRTLSGPEEPCVVAGTFVSVPTSDEDGPSPARSAAGALPADRTLDIGMRYVPSPLRNGRPFKKQK